jgi:predicted transcriptional regulator
VKGNPIPNFILLLALDYFYKSSVSKQKYYKDLGKRIREVRKKKGISIKDFESMDNSFDKAHLSKMENGVRHPTIYTLQKIADVLGVDIADFFKTKS